MYLLFRNFNSIKVRLKLPSDSLPKRQESYFNSIKVRLKLVWPRTFITTLIFQFHKGTIKTCAVLVRLVASRLYFNSIKVRLKQRIFMKLDLNQIYFNSIKVRLKPKPVILKYEIEEFQFHKGTIKTVNPESSKVISVY